MKPLLAVLCLIIGLLPFATSKANWKKYLRRQQEPCDDIAIIGAGIAGTYTGWRLRNLGKKITIYEYSDRIGGRFYTHRFPEAPHINVELGAMRFIPDEHPLLHNLVRELRLPTRKFEQGSGPSPDTLMYLRGKHIRYGDLGGFDNPYNLRRNEQKHVDILKWETFKNGTNTDDINKPEDEKAYCIKTNDGVYLYKQSALSVYHKSRSQEAVNYIMDTSGFPTTTGQFNAIYTISSRPTDQATTEVLTVVSGFSSIAATLLKIFMHASSRHQTKMNQHLQSIKRRQDGSYNLYFEPTESTNGYTKILQGKALKRYCARKVVLAINRLSLEKLDWSGVQQPKVKKLITNSVEDIPAAKIFYSYQYPWWERSSTYNIYAISDTPLTQTYGFGTSKVNPPASVLMASYTDSTPSLWREIVQRNEFSTNTPRKVLNHITSSEMYQLTNKYLSQLYKVSPFQIPLPTSGVIGLWDSYPYGGAWQIHKPGFNIEEVEKIMVKPSKSDDVFVVSNAFNSRALSVWGEGALQTVELAMTHLGLRPRRMKPNAKQLHYI